LRRFGWTVHGFGPPPPFASGFDKAAVVRIVLWHGYLLGGTGSNVYTRALARAWSRLGHEVVVVCQERNPGAYDLGGARVVRPELPGKVLPVFVLDRYEGLEPRLLQELTPAERERYVEANAAAVRAELPADLVFANHVVLGGPVASAAGAPYAVKAHGSELEYSMRGNEELAAWGRESLARATATYVGSAHIRAVLEEVVGHVDHVHEVPPGVDTDEFKPEQPTEALERLLAEARRDPPNPGNAEERLPDEGNAERLAAWFESDEPTVLYFGKLLYNKGVHVLFEALRETGSPSRAIIVGFGDYRAELERIAPPRTLFTGPLEHRHLVHLLPLCEVTVVPSIFPEAFGMVAAEAAAAGSLPLIARHSGLAEIAEGLEAEYPPDYHDLTSFETGNASDLDHKLSALLALSAKERQALREAARRAVVRRWSWEQVSGRLLQPFTN
jgi:glycosyltransferase involved in cell wall biosynthesis